MYWGLLLYKVGQNKGYNYILLLKVKIWFQNRRMKWRNSKERELLSQGGNREQTLPSKDNQNPDLSDPQEHSGFGDFIDLNNITGIFI